MLYFICKYDGQAFKIIINRIITEVFKLVFYTYLCRNRDEYLVNN
jgi:hypothetical protein